MSKKDPRLTKNRLEGFNKPKKTPSHPTKSHVVLAKEGDNSGIDGFTWFEANKHLLPQTRIDQSQSGGQHYYYQHSEGLKCSNSAVHKCVDIKADGGYIIAEGHGYELLKDMSLNQPPPSLGFVTLIVWK